MRNEYRLDLSGPLPACPEPGPGFNLRRPTEADAEALAELMLEAYRGTIDYDGETLEDARREIRAYFEGGYGKPLPQLSWIVFAREQPVAAGLISLWVEQPLVSWVMTRARWKGKGLGSLALYKMLESLQAEGYAEVRAVITAGNLPSEQLFRKAGFHPVSGQNN